MTNALHPKAAYWITQGIFDELQSFEAFEARVNKIVGEKDRGDIFEIFVEGYLATQTITQCVKHWVVGNIPLSLRERYNLPRDATGIDGIYETHDGSHVAYQVKYRQKQQLTFAEVAPFLGITEQFRIELYSPMPKGYPTRRSCELVGSARIYSVLCRVMH